MIIIKMTKFCTKFIYILSFCGFLLLFTNPAICMKSSTEKVTVLYEIFDRTQNTSIFNSSQALRNLYNASGGNNNNGHRIIVLLNKCVIGNETKTCASIPPHQLFTIDQNTFIQTWAVPYEIPHDFHKFYTKVGEYNVDISNKLTLFQNFRLKDKDLEAQFLNDRLRIQTNQKNIIEKNYDDLQKDYNDLQKELQAKDNELMFNSKNTINHVNFLLKVSSNKLNKNAPACDKYDINLPSNPLQSNLQNKVQNIRNFDQDDNNS